MYPCWVLRARRHANHRKPTCNLFQELQLEKEWHSQALSLIEDRNHQLEKYKRDMQSEKDARKEMNEVYQSKLAELCHKIQELEQEVEEATQIRMDLENALETEIDLCRHLHGLGGECTKHSELRYA